MLGDKSNSCLKCQNLYASLQTHFTEAHCLSASSDDSVLTNILLNVLSLLVAKPAAVSQKNTNSNSQQQQFSRSQVQSSLLNTKPGKKTDENKQKLVFLNDYHSGTIVSATPTSLELNQQSAYLQPTESQMGLLENPPLQTPETSPAIDKSDIPQTSQASLHHENDDNEDGDKTSKNNTENNISDNNLAFPFLIQASDIQPALIAPDGSFTSVGLSFLLANQNKMNSQGGGKSDQLDVADILVNKMPIPSLNKGQFDPSLLSTLYLQNFNEQTNQSFAFQDSQTPSNKDALQQLLISRHKKLFLDSLNTTRSSKVRAKRMVGVRKKKVVPATSTSTTADLVNPTNVFPVVEGGNTKASSSTTSSNNVSRETNLENFSLEHFLNIIKSQAKSPVEVTSENAQILSPTHSREDLTTLRSLILETAKEVGDISIESSKASKPPLSTYTTIPLSVAGEQLKEEATKVQRAKVLYKCEACGITFSVFSTLQSHMKSEHSLAPETCTFCQQTFNTADQFQQHLLTHRAEQGLLICDTCHKVFSNDADLQKHALTHQQRRPYACVHCSKAFRDPGSLKKHERIHTGELPFACQVCGRAFAEKSSLNKHARTHSGERPYKCDECGKTFTISGNLQRHMFTHNGERPFCCTHCKKTFNNPSHLRRHIKNIHQKQQKLSQRENKSDEETDKS